MHKVYYGAAVAVAAAVFCAAGRADDSAYDKGKALYMQKCMICHGVNGKGNGPAADALSRPPRDFNDPELWKRQDVDQFIANTVKKGIGEMPAFKLSDDEISAIIAYMSQTFGGKKPAPSPAG